MSDLLYINTNFHIYAAKFDLVINNSDGTQWLADVLLTREGA